MVGFDGKEYGPLSLEIFKEFLKQGKSGTKQPKLKLTIQSNGKLAFQVFFLLTSEDKKQSELLEKEIRLLAEEIDHKLTYKDVIDNSPMHSFFITYITTYPLYSKLKILVNQYLEIFSKYPIFDILTSFGRSPMAQMGLHKK